MPPDAVEILRQEMAQTRREIREDLGKIFDRLTDLEKAKHANPCEPLRGHIQDHKETRGKILSVVLSGIVRLAPWLLTGALALKTWMPH